MARFGLGGHHITNGQWEIIRIPEKLFSTILETYLNAIKRILTVGQRHIGKPVKDC
jgi:hypothetical protein